MPGPILSEQDIRTKRITPAIARAGWDLETQLREEVTFTAGRIIVRGKMVARGKQQRADYVLYHRAHLPIAIVEAKDNSHAIGAGIQQALAYAEALDAPFAFSSNGEGFLFRDRTRLAEKPEVELAIDEFPPPEELWRRYRQWKGWDEAAERVATQPYHADAGGKAPRYYQENAINRAVDAIARGQKRVLLVMATGTGKTYVAFQIIWRLWKSRTKRRILFLADRNILVDQTKSNDFKPFGTVMTKITDRKVDTSYEVYLALYQAVSGTEEERNVYRQFSPDFFDLIVVDECHRGSARANSAWREILEYFGSATQIGLTATPKETRDVSNIDYFGEPLYTYSLKQGIEDGFLAPYKVIRIDLDKDLTGYRPERGKRDRHGEEIEDRIYNQRDFDRTLVLDQRTEVVAARVAEFLRDTDPYAKTIVFCEDVEHAERMRSALVNALPEHQHETKYVMRITGDNPEGKAELDQFIHPEVRYPVIATTSKLLTTGVDAKTCQLIVLDQRIESMTEFKQIIGRGTRIHEDTGKLYFTIMDFKKATELFADPDFDGQPVQIYTPAEGDPVVPPPSDAAPGDDAEAEIDRILVNPDAAAEAGASAFTDLGADERRPRRKYYVGDVPVTIFSERVQYVDKDGKLVTESLRDYTRKAVRREYASLHDFLKRWDAADRKQAIVDELREQGVILEAVQEEAGRELDAFDLICHVAFDQPPLTRRERADNVRKRDVFTKYGPQARAVLDALLQKYADEGVGSIERLDILKVRPLSDLGTPIEIVRAFGGRDQYLAAIRTLQSELYSPPAA